jgi:membrane associated rhomboid family serine protease
MIRPMAMPLRSPGRRYTATGPPVWRTRFWSTTVWIIVITCIVSITDMLLLGWLSHWFSLRATDMRRGFVWELLTFQLLHAGPGHLLFNMLWLYFLGPIIEPMLGKRRFVTLYLASGVAGGLAFLLMQRIGAAYGPGATLVGASAGIFGVMAAAVCVAPRLAIRFWFPPVAIPLWVLFVASVVLALLTIRTGGWNSGGEVAHLGGAFAGLLLFRQRGLLDRLSRGGKRSRFWRPGDPATRFFRDGAA